MGPFRKHWWRKLENLVFMMYPLLSSDNQGWAECQKWTRKLDYKVKWTKWNHIHNQGTTFHVRHGIWWKINRFGWTFVYGSQWGSFPYPAVIFWFKINLCSKCAPYCAIFCTKNISCVKYFSLPDFMCSHVLIDRTLFFNIRGREFKSYLKQRELNCELDSWPLVW